MPASPTKHEIVKSQRSLDFHSFGKCFVPPDPKKKNRPNSGHFQNRFQKSILLIVKYKYLKSCSEDLILKNLILLTRSCGTTFITPHSWLLHFRQAEICLIEMIFNSGVPIPKRHLGGASP